MNIFIKAKHTIRNNWWGIIPGFFIIAITVYIGIWTLIESLDIPHSINWVPVFFNTRPFIHISFSLILATLITIVLDLFIKWDKLQSKNEPPNTFIKSYSRSQHPDFFKEVEKVIPQSKKITLIAIGLNLLWEDHILDILLKAIQDGTDVTICMANPLSPHVSNRLVEEQMHNNLLSNSLEQTIKNLLQKFTNMGGPSNFKITLFDHYPTFATLIFDDNIYIYPYAYGTSGNFSPIFHYKDDNSAVAVFYTSNAKKIIKDSIPAIDIISFKKNKRHFSQDWISAAVYIVPNLKSSFYKFGSEILGYDIRQNVLIEENTLGIQNLKNYTGEAKNYGFHATLADALFFTSESEIDRVKSELETITEFTEPFLLSDLTIKNNFREEGEIVITCSDNSGNTEILHHELIERFYKLSLSSTYLTGLTDKTLVSANKDRAKLMLKTYGAPYIMKEFVLHFTLCSNAPIPKTSPERNKTFNKLELAYFKRVKETSLFVNEICLLIKRKGDERWKIEAVYPLKGK